jgi:DNA-binding Xre family transcriptional regulator
MISYKKLWKILIDKDMKKKDLEKVAGISSYTINKLNRGDNVTMEVLDKICLALNCNIGDICDAIPLEQKTLDQ